MISAENCFENETNERFIKSRVLHLFVPGISRSNPAFMAPSIEYTPNLRSPSARIHQIERGTYQSLIVVASLAHSLRRMSWMMWGFSDTCVPLTRL